MDTRQRLQVRPALVALLPPQGGPQSVRFPMARSVRFSVAIDRKAERGVRTFRSAFGEAFRRGAGSLEELGRRLDDRAGALMDRLTCPVTGTTVTEAFRAEQRALQPLPTPSEPFDVVVSRKVSRDCLVSFDGRRYSVPFAWAGRNVDVWGTLTEVAVRGGGAELARHRRGTEIRLVIDPDHYEGPLTREVERPTPLGRRARLQLAGLSSTSRHSLLRTPDREVTVCLLEDYVRLVEALR